MRKQKTKLSLDRETLVSLQPNSLDAVNGGNANITTACPPSHRNCSDTCFLCMPPPVGQ